MLYSILKVKIKNGRAEELKNKINIYILLYKCTSCFVFIHCL